MKRFKFFLLSIMVMFCFCNFSLINTYAAEMSSENGTEDIVIDLNDYISERDIEYVMATGESVSVPIAYEFREEPTGLLTGRILATFDITYSDGVSVAINSASMSITGYNNNIFQWTTEGVIYNDYAEARYVRNFTHINGNTNPIQVSNSRFTFVCDYYLEYYTRINPI